MSRDADVGDVDEIPDTRDATEDVRDIDGDVRDTGKDTRERRDGFEDSDVSPRTCNYRHKSRGVCADATLVTRSDAGGDAGLDRRETGVCQQPDDYESDEGSCDTKDNDCDGTIDEGCPCNVNGTSDGVCSEGTIADDGSCQPPQTYDSTDSEVSDSNCDQLDNDCDGTVDEGCGCNYKGQSQGVCPGQSRDDSGNCQKPSNYTSPTDDESSVQLCDGLDNDCDGAVDEGCPCNFQGQKTGVCSGQTIAPSGTCSKPNEYESPESSCDGLDNDCDGMTDENLTDGSCGTNTGVCSMGTRECINGTFKCRGQTTGSNETCDGRDEDCDGTVDENTDGAQTTCGTGQCRSTGREVCRNGQITDTCNPGTSSSEICDGKDNDCDGTTDEGLGGSTCGTDTGVCTTGTRRCVNGSFACQGNDAGSSETCDGNDNDCDGTTDEGLGGGTCGTNTGVCTTGTRECVDGSYICRGNNTGSNETCDGQDNDCDGTIDEGCSCNYQGTSQGVCSNGTIGPNGNCQAPSNYQSKESTCDDNVDNDCDGDTDCVDGNCSPGDIGCLRPGAKCNGDPGRCRSNVCNRVQNGTNICVHTIFVTSKTYNGGQIGQGPNVNPLQNADAICNKLTDSGEWRALLSSASTSARSRIDIATNSSIVNIGGSKVFEVADSEQDLWNSSNGDYLDLPIRYTENGNRANFEEVWSGTKADGTSAPKTCSSGGSSWNSASRKDRGQVGETSRTDGRWINDGISTCNSQLRLYCIEASKP